MKKTFLLTLLALLVLTLAFTACGSSTPATTENNTSSDTTPSSAAGSGTAGVTTTAPVTTKNPVMESAYDHPENYVKLPEFSSIEVSMAPIQKDVDTYLAQVLGALGREDYKALENGVAAILGDKANINYTGRAKDPSVKLSDDTLKGMSNASDAAGYDLVLGSGSFIPGFEEQLVGAKIGDTVTVDVTFPENYHSQELCGVAVLFEVKINSLSRATVGEKNVLALLVTYTLKEGTATSELAKFMEGHEVQFDLRDAAAKFDEYFDAQAIRTALLGKSTFGKASVDLTLPLDAAKKFGYETELTLTADITVEQIVYYPEVLTDGDIDYYTGGEYKTVAAFTEYVTNHYKSTYAYEAISKAATYTINETVYNLLYKGYYDSKVTSLIGDISNMTEEELAEKYTDEVKKTADEFAKSNATAEYNDRMLLSYLANKVNFVLTDEIYQKELAEMYNYYLANYYYQMIMSGINSKEAFESYFGKDTLETEFISSNVIDKLPNLVSYVD
ncbi:MAG: FKBP-type peptidyl-prolyl cis-trans isomerase [Clostridia bacterium]|nr:FKBP-type peptidyl-prolyl cis-trans isomerase [Clostridia bacterium]